MSKIVERYSSAVRSGNLKSEPDTTYSDSDVVGAMGFAGHELRVREDGTERNSSPLAASILRVLMGDKSSVSKVVELLAETAWGWAKADGVKLRRVQAVDMARAVLAWHRFGTCKTCGGHGFKRVEGAPTLSGEPCPACDRSGRVRFNRQFSMEHLVVATRLLDHVEAEMGRAGRKAMDALAADLRLP